MILLDKKTRIILDVSDTLMGVDGHPLEGAREFMQKYKDQILILSNVGSLTGEKLRIKLENSLNIQIKRVITSLDLVIDRIKSKDFGLIFHYGSDTVQKELEKIPGVQVTHDWRDSKINTLLFTSLCSGESYIRKTQGALNTMTRKGVNVILANPDRSRAHYPFNFTVATIYDALIIASNKLGFFPETEEIGKPNLSLNKLENESDINNYIVVGDNPYTDGELARNNNVPFIQVGSWEYNQDLEVVGQKIKSLKDLL